MNWLNYHHLLYFREITIRGSITKAAKELRISPPALSSQLKLLEENLGEPLFDRKGRELILNSFGKEIFKYAQQVYNSGQNILNLANSNSSANKMTIRLGFSDGLSKSIVKMIVLKLRKKFKETQISIWEGKQNELISNLHAHDLDLIFTNRICHDHHGEIISKEFNSQNVSIYGAKKYSKLKDNFPKSIESQPIIMPSLHSDIRHSVDQWFIEQKLHYDMVAEVEDSAVKKMLAVEGIGLAPLPDYGAKDLVKDGLLIRIGSLKNIKEQYFMTTRKNQKLKNKGVDFLVEALL